jgi:hypothetical protein
MIYKKIINCIIATELKKHGKSLLKIRNKWMNKVRGAQPPI